MFHMPLCLSLIPQSLAPLFRSMEQVNVFRGSVYLAQGTNIVHLISMVTFMGALLMVDLRLLGLGLTREPARELARTARPWLVGGFLGLVITGVPAVMTVATQEFANKVFWIKMYVLAAAIVWTFLIRPLVLRMDEPQFGAKLVGFVSIALWLGVAAGGRLIMYF